VNVLGVKKVISTICLVKGVHSLDLSFAAGCEAPEVRTHPPGHFRLLQVPSVSLPHQGESESQFSV